MTKSERRTAANKRVICEAIKGHLVAHGVSQKDAAKRLDISASRVSNLVNGHVNLFSLEGLTGHATRLGLTVTVSVE